MTNYTKLIERLRSCSRHEAIYGMVVITMADVADAADAIEHLNHLVDLNTERCEGLRKQLREAQDGYDKHINELQDELKELCDKKREFKRACGLVVDESMPKHGEWTRKRTIAHDGEWYCSKCDNEVVILEAGKDRTYKYAYCPNCGARMFASDINVLNKNDTLDGPIITPCLGCSEYDGYGGCKSNGGCVAKMEVQE